MTYLKKEAGPECGGQTKGLQASISYWSLLSGSLLVVYQVVIHLDS